MMKSSDEEMGGTFGQSEVLATFTVLRVTKIEEVQVNSRIRGEDKNGSVLEIVELGLPWSEGDQEVRIGNTYGAISMGNVCLRIQDPKHFGKFKVGAKLHLMVDVEEMRVQ